MPARALAFGILAQEARALLTRLARQEALTARQRQLLRMNFEQNKTVTEIAQELGVNKSTVSRTLLRAKRRLYQCLRYAL